MHRLAGVWSLWFVLLIALTGLWYLVEQLGLDAPSPQWRAVTGAAPGRAFIDGAAVDRAVAQAARDWPGLVIRSVALDDKRGTITLEGQADAVLVRDRVNALRYSTDGMLLERVAGTDLGVHQRISEMADPLHFGNFAGLPVKLIWFTFGLLLTALSITGTYLYGLRALGRRKQATGQPRAPHAIAEASSSTTAWRLAWRAMRHWRWLWLLLAAIWLWLMQAEIAK